MKSKIILLFLIVFSIKSASSFCAESIVFTWSIIPSSIPSTIGLTATGGEDFTVDWGDGTGNDTYTGTQSIVSPLHTYSNAGDYTVTITGSSGCSFTWMNVERSGIKTLDISNTSLHTLFSEACGLTSLILGDITTLTYLDCNNNQLTSLDVSNNTGLTHLYCRNNQLTSLNTSNNPALKTLRCSANQLATLNVSNSPALDILECSNNSIATLDISNNKILSDLDCFGNELTALNVSNNTLLRSLSCGDNLISTLDISNNLDLITLYCQNNQLTVLNVDNNTALSVLHCANNQITTLNVSNNMILSALYCENNKITGLDVSNKTSLFDLNCSNNQLTILNMNNTSATILNCNNNQLPISTLYMVSLVISMFKVLSPQNLATVTTTVNIPVNMSGEMILAGTQTDFSIMKNGVAASLDIDYRLDYTASTITFLTEGNYEATLTNSAIISDDQAQVIIPFVVQTSTSSNGDNDSGGVTVGCGIPPARGALLQLKENGNTGANSKKGLLLSRVSITTLNSLDDIATGLDAAEHVGLIVYNMNEDADAGIYKGLYVWNGTAWERLNVP